MIKQLRRYWTASLDKYSAAVTSSENNAIIKKCSMCDQILIIPKTPVAEETLMKAVSPAHIVNDFLYKKQK